MSTRQLPAPELLVETADGTERVSVGERRGETAVERRIEVDCATGDRIGSRWQGVPLTTVLEDVSLPTETTHLSFESADGLRCCIDVPTALDGLLALACDGDVLQDDRAYDTRLVAPGVEGVRCLKEVERVVPLSLAPGEDPTEHEYLKLDDEE